MCAIEKSNLSNHEVSKYFLPLIEREESIFHQFLITTNYEEKNSMINEFYKNNFFFFNLNINFCLNQARMLLTAGNLCWDNLKTSLGYTMQGAARRSFYAPYKRLIIRYYYIIKFF